MSPSTKQNAMAAIQAADREFERLANAHDAAAMGETYYTEDATVLPPNAPPVQGRAAVVSFWTAFVAATQPSNVKLDTTHVEESGDLAYGVGSYEFLAGGALQTGKYLVAFRRQADGSYKCVADAFGPNA